MKDAYPESTIPPGRLVPPEHQPEYEDYAPSEVRELTNLGEAIADANVRRGHGDMVAGIHAESGRSFTFTELATCSDRVAATLLALGVRLGDRLAFRTPNLPELLPVICGAWKAGAVVVPTPAQAPPDELRFFLEDTGAKFMLVGGGDAERGVAEAVDGTGVEHVLSFGPGAEAPRFEPWTAREPAERPPIPEVPSDSVAVLWHTGGTTGRPKGCYHTHRRFIYGGEALRDAIGTRPGERWAAAAPVGHALGFLHHTSYSVLHGAAAVFVEAFQSPEALLDAIDRHRVTTFTAITASWARMSDVLDASEREYELGSIDRAFALWQSASSGAVFDAWKARGVHLLNNFGSTAFASWVLVPHEGDSPPRASLGRAEPGYRVEAMGLEEGRLEPVPPGTTGRMAVRGPTGLTYWNRPELQERDVVDGWTLSDDLLAFDSNGNATYLGRTDYLISTAGYKVPPGEVERTLAAHPAVAEVAVVGAPDAIRQQVVMAFVALGDGFEESDGLRRELQDTVKANLAPYKYPRRLEFIDALPRDAVGKVRHAVIKGWADEMGNTTSTEGG